MMPLLPTPNSFRPGFARTGALHRLAIPAAVLMPLLLWLGAPGARATLIASGDGSGNTSAPAADPGFANVGVVNGLSGVYVRNGWVLTAGHVGEHPILLDGVTYAPFPGSAVRFQNSDGSDADLLAFKLTTRPPLPDLVIARAQASRNLSITMIGNGRNRGAPTSWNGQNGFEWAPGRAIRWGTNRVASANEFSLNTHAFWTYFDEISNPSPGQHEADIVAGDSGGAAFTGSGATAELVGILFARAAFQDQPAGTSIYGNAGLIVDLAVYRDQIVALIDQPACSDGFDDDGDGLTDHPEDPGCTSPDDLDEHEPDVVCDNELDDDGDGLIDLEDPGCAAPGDADERGAAYECDNGLDDDGDGLFDFPEDDGCLHPTNPVEAPEPGFGLALAIGVAGLRALGRGRRCRSDQSFTRSTR